MNGIYFIKFGRKKAVSIVETAFISIVAYLQQSAFVQVDLVHFCPLEQLVQVACLALDFFTGALATAIDDAAKAIASVANIIFFILISYYSY
jgi:hypothetical protein